MASKLKKNYVGVSFMTGILRIFLFLNILACIIAHAQAPKPVDMENGLLKISFDKSSRTWSLYENESNQWKTVISSASISITFQEGDSVFLGNETGEITAKVLPFSDAIGRGKKMDVMIAGPSARWSLEFVLYDGKMVLAARAAVQNLSGRVWNPKNLHLIDITGAGYLAFKTENVLMHINGYQSWSGCDVLRLDSIKQNASYWSALFFEPEARSSILAGFVTDTASINSIRAGQLDPETARMHMATESDVRNTAVREGEEIVSDRIILSLDPSPSANLERYGLYLQTFSAPVSKPFTPAGREPVKSTGKQGIPAGWCSWYYYYQNISEDSILQNLNFAWRNLSDAGLRYIQIDDGYQIAAGDWAANKKFPHGHKWMVRQIHEKGFLAGLWIAPFAVAESSTVFREHPEWLLRESDTLKVFFTNEWWGGRIYSLDPTIPEVQAWLKNLFSKIVGEWGYDYVKIDFLYFPAEVGKYSLPVSGARAYRMGLQAIRSGVGTEKFILGCGAPLGCSIGFVDGMRIGTDIYAGWGGITPGAAAAAHRFFYHQAVWYNDPDCLVVRDPLTLDEARVWASAVALSGGVNMLGDKLGYLSRERVELLKMSLPSYGVGAVPVDLFSMPKPQGLTIIAPGGQSTLRLPSRWKFSPGDSTAWKNPSFDDSRWPEIDVPAQWETAGYPSLDGFAWYRVKFSVPPDWKKGRLTLFLGKIEDCDETYLNGNIIGKSGNLPPDYSSEWTAFRTYEIPEDYVIGGGVNTLAIRVYDGGGAGGIYSGSQENLPSIWNLKVDKPFGKWNVVGVFNWSDAEKSFRLDASDLGLSPRKKYVAYELWEGKFLGGLTGGLVLKLRPRSSNILSIHEMEERPFILSTSRHITQGAVDIANVQWDAGKKTLSVSSDRLLKGDYAVTLFVPAGMAIKSVSVPARYDISNLGDSVYIVTFPDNSREKLNWKVIFQ